MADKITEIVGQEAFDQVEKLKLELKQLTETFEKSARVALLMNSALSNTNGIKDTSNAIRQQQSALSELDKLRAKIIYQSTETAKVEAELRLEVQRLTMANKDFVKGQQAKEGSIVSLRVQIKDLQLQYDRMASAERDASKGTELLKHINDVDTQLKKLEAGSGRFQRNVGNYASGWSPLSSAMGQITRELPNFGQSLQIGVLSLTNNIGALQDAVKGINAENKILKSEGKTTSSALSQIAGALFSWNTVLYVGIGLLSAYSKEIFAFIDELFSVKEPFDAFVETQKQLNKALEDTSVKNAVTNINELRINIELAKEGFINKERVVKQYNETIGKTTGLVSNLDEAEKELEKNADAYVKMTLYKTASNLAMEESAKLLLEAEKIKLKELKKNSTEVVNNFTAELDELKAIEFGDTYKNQKAIREKQAQDDLKRRQAQKDKAIKIAMDGAKEQENIGKKLMKIASETAKQMNFNIFGDTKAPKDPKAKAEPKVAEVDRIAELKKQYEREQKILETSFKDKTITEEQYYYDSIQKASKFIDKRIGLSKKETETEIDFNIDLKAKATDFHNKLIDNSLKELKATQDVYGTQQELAKKKFGFIQKLADDDLKKSLDILKKASDETQRVAEKNANKKIAYQQLVDASIEASAEISRTITDRLIYDTERLAEIELKKVDKQEQAELASLERMTLSENERATRKKAIELEAEERRKAIEKEKIKDLRRFAVIQKSIDVAQIISSTALGIVRQLSSAVDIANQTAIPKAIALALTGAVQLAKVLATPLPQYARGIESTPNDGYAIVGEKGTELVTEKSGKQYLTPNSDTLTYLPKGSKVTPHHELMANVYDNAHKYMANSSNITTDTMQTALIESFEELYNKVDNLSEIMAKKNMNVSIFGDFEHAMRIKKSRM